MQNDDLQIASGSNLSFEDSKRLGLNLARSGQIEEALHVYTKACELNGGDADVWFMLGALKGSLGRIEEAIACCQRATQINPAHADAHYNLAQAYAHLGKHEDAIAALSKVVQLAPRHSEALINLGCLLQQAGKSRQAIECYNKVLQLQPGNINILHNLALALHSDSRTDEAIKCLRIVLRHAPDFVAAYRDLATALIKNNMLHQAHDCLHAGLMRTPDDIGLSRDLGVLLGLLKKPEEAIGVFRRILQIQPDFAEGHFHIGRILRGKDRLSEATDHLRQALALNPGYVEAREVLGTVLLRQGLHDEAEIEFQRGLRDKPQSILSASGLLWVMNYRLNDPEAVFRQHLHWAELHAKGLPYETFDNKPLPDRRLRVGYVSADLKAHSVAFFLWPLLANHNRDQIEAVCYSDVAQPDSVTEGLRRLVPVWRDIRGKSDQEVAELIREDQIDILVDLAGHTGGNRLLVFARKPAPIQVTYLGYPNTTGLSTIDYRLTDAWADPPNRTDPWHTETLVRLPEGFLCYKPPVDAMPVTAPPFIQTGHVTFGSFNNLAKVTPDMLECWARILRAVPDSRLILKNNSGRDAAVRERYYGLLDRLGVDSSRIQIVEWMETLGQHLAWYEQVDIALDTFPYNGTTTTCEAMWMGVPVVTLAGDMHVGRVGVSLLTQVDLTELIATNREDYVNIAVDLATSPDRLTELRRGLREKMRRSPLCDGAAFAKQVENEYRTMWKRWCEGQC